MKVSHRSTPLVSVVSPMYNAQRWVASVVGGTRAQTFRDFEHLLVDDASNDDTVREARAAIGDDPRYRIVSMRANAGPGAARDAGLAVARGRYVAFLDADDAWLPEKLERQLAFMQRTGHAFTFHDYRFMSHDGARVGALVSPPEILDFRSLHTRRGFGCLTVMLDREQIGHVSFAADDRSLPEDFLCWLSIVKQGYCGHRLPDDLARYRLLPVSRSSNKSNAARAVWNIYRHVEKLPLHRAVGWWLQYAMAAYRLHRVAAPPR